jgi:hypothetical protein|tara:strand:+ start:291 stop:494 length:204 start_codon:yes stop_codon:yes gene_type:complete
MVLSCDMDNPVILWRLKSQSERDKLLKKCCSETYDYGSINSDMSLDELKKQVHESYEIDSLIKLLRN